MLSKLKRIATGLIACSLILSLFVPSALAADEPLGTIKTIKSDRVAEGTLQTFNIKMVPFSDGRTREVLVWFPKGYNSKDKSKTYPVIYMQDGQIIFNTWGIEDSICDYVHKGNQGSIIVAVTNDG